MRVNIIAGFLGSGKTTLLKNVLGGLVQREKIAVLVNEFGDVGLDGSTLQGESIDMIELASGCICCSMKADLMKAAQEIATRINPHRLFIEATGIARPLDVLETLSHPEVMPLLSFEPVVTVIDASKFFLFLRRLPHLYEAQIKSADLLVLNKTDLVDSGDLKEVRSILKKIALGIPIIETSFCVLEAGFLSNEGLHRAFPSAGSPIPKRLSLKDSSRHEHEHESRNPFRSFTYREKGTISEARLRDFLETLPEDTFRIKGYINLPEGTAFLNYSAGNYQLDPFPEPRENCLVFVGLDLEKGELLEMLHKCIIEKGGKCD